MFVQVTAEERERIEQLIQPLQLNKEDIRLGLRAWGLGLTSLGFNIRI